MADLSLTAVDTRRPRVYDPRSTEAAVPIARRQVSRSSGRGRLLYEASHEWRRQLHIQSTGARLHTWKRRSNPGDTIVETLE